MEKTTSYLKKNQDLEFILNKVKKLAVLQENFSACLDPKIKNYCQVANITNKILIVIVANGSIATQLRYLTKDLLTKIKLYPALNMITDIQFKVRPSPTESTNLSHSTPRKVSDLSQQSADIVKEIASTIRDPALRAAMNKIAQHTAGKTLKKEDTKR